MYDLIIIGSGPAGLSAAVYGKRAGLNLLVIEKNPMSGGQILNTYEVDNYLGLPGINGFDMGVKFRDHAEGMGVEFLEAEVGTIEDGEVKTVHTDAGDHQARTLILTTGAEHAKLGAPGEEEFSGRGVSYCATCDGAFFKNKRVAVVGGGDVALEDAIYLARTCEKVYVFLRRDEFRGARILQEELLALPNVEVCYSTVVQEIRGGDMVDSLSVRRLKSGTEEVIEISGVFIAVGIRPNTGMYQELVACDEQGYVLAGEDGATDAPGIFVAGDARKKALRQVVTAVADGANAAVSAANYLNHVNKNETN